MNEDNSSGRIAILENAVTSNPGSLQTIRELALAYADQKRWNEAVEKYQIAISLDSSNADLYNETGVAYEELGKLQEAEKAYQRAMALNPNDAIVCYNLGDLYQKQQRVPEAVQMYQKCLQLTTDPQEQADIRTRIANLTAGTQTGQSRLAYRIAATILFIGLLINLVSLFMGGEGTTVISSLIDFALAIGLLQFRPGAQKFTLFRAVMGAIFGPVLAFMWNDPFTASLITVMQWGYCGAIILLLTGQSSTWRLILAAAIFTVFRVGVFVVLLLLVLVARAFGGV